MRYFMQDGVRYHHIFDKKTGFPAQSGVMSVTIISENGMLGDALSTACFVMGPEESKHLLEQYRAEAVFIMETGEILVSSSLFGSITLTEQGENYTLRVL